MGEEWPKIISVFVHGNNKEAMLSKGEALGLSGEALRLFSFACVEIEVMLEVQADGNAKILGAK